ncbi:hypothetical protein [Emticicia sp. TH156]|uniref:hypothetical protein n=1 Tax=Emticicia sp. TH156 TaxID=2067454 RepID=UPI000C780CCE|nr:hypothetical protein [Emticicia sp. TH156]PLK44902.1 hypothetical protein C0V77_06540 [Emticicia sp. TH156]
MTIQPVLVYSTFFAKKKSYGSKGFCSKAMSCRAEKEFVAENKDSDLKSCASKKTPVSGKEDSEKGCTKADCGPFTICSYCCILPMDRLVFSFSDFLQEIEKARLIDENISSNYISDSWHPPEFI